MIKAKFFIGSTGISGFEIRGHADHGEAGNDIVCAAVSSSAYMAANTITDVVCCRCDVSESGGELRLTLSEVNESAQFVLKGLELHLREMEKQYPANIKVIYGGVKNA